MLETVRNTIWGPFTILFILLSGILLTFAIKFCQITSIPHILKETFASKRSSSMGYTPYQALCTTLGGTLGVGNLSAVAASICIGGPGAVFWMMVISFFGMAIKYSEIFLSAVYRKADVKGNYRSGPQVYIRDGLNSRVLSYIYCIFCIFSSLIMGCAMQANTVAKAFSSDNEIKLFIGIALMAVTASVILGKANKIMKFSTAIVPIMSVLYFAGAIIFLVIRYDRIYDAIALILKNAFDFSSVSGGIVGVLTGSSISQGFSCGVLTNEAGLGTAAIAHSQSKGKNPHTEGLWGILEVFVATFMMCTLTAMVILTSDTYANNLMNATGINLTIKVYSEIYGNFAQIFIAVCVMFLALTSIVGWNYYGQMCVEFLTDSIYVQSLYKRIFLIALIIGVFMPFKELLVLSDIFNALMTFPNLIALTFLSFKIYEQNRCIRKIN